MGQMIKPDRMKQAMLAKGMTMANLAREIGVTGPAIKLILNGSTARSRHAPDIARALDVGVRWLLGETDDASPDAIAMPSKEDLAEQFNLVRVREVDVAYSMGGGAIVEDSSQVRYRHFDADWLGEVTKSPADLLFVARGIGDSMTPTLLDNDTLLVDRGQNVINMQDRLWSLSYGELAMVKRVRRLPNGNYLIISDNPQVADFEASPEEFYVIGRVVWIGRKS